MDSKGWRWRVCRQKPCCIVQFHCSAGTLLDIYIHLASGKKSYQYHCNMDKKFFCSHVQLVTRGISSNLQRHSNLCFFECLKPATFINELKMAIPRTASSKDKSTTISSAYECPNWLSLKLSQFIPPPPWTSYKKKIKHTMLKPKAFRKSSLTSTLLLYCQPGCPWGPDPPELPMGSVPYVSYWFLFESSDSTYRELRLWYSFYLVCFRNFLKFLLSIFRFINIWMILFS